MRLTLADRIGLNARKNTSQITIDEFERNKARIIEETKKTYWELVLKRFSHNLGKMTLKKSYSLGKRA